MQYDEKTEGESPRESGRLEMFMGSAQRYLASFGGEFHMLAEGF